LQVLPTVGFPVVQFNPIQQPLMAVGIVRKAGAPTDAAVRSNAAIEGICERHLK
jgi:hypothetical protein